MNRRNQAIEKVVFILLEEFADWEVTPLAAELNTPDADHPAFEVLFASDKVEFINSIGGMKVMPDMRLNEITDDFKALFLIGGTGWRSKSAEALVPIVKRFLDQGKVVGTICDSARFMAANGLLNNHKHTGNFKEEIEEEELYTNSVNFIEDESVLDRNLITANGQAPYLFAKNALLALGIDPVEVQKWYDFNSMGLQAAIKKYY